MSTQDCPLLWDGIRQSPDIRFLDVAALDLNGQWRGKRVPVGDLSKLIAGEIKLPISSVVMDAWGADVLGSGLPEAGDVDGTCWPLDLPPLMDLNQPEIARVQVALRPTAGGDFGGDGRQVLARAVSHLAARGLSATVASELEFYLLKPDSVAAGEPLPIGSTDPAVYDLESLGEVEGVLQDVRTLCEAAAIPVDTMLAEYGPGQYELNLKHRSDALRAADDAVRLRWVIRRAATAHGYLACFMPKLWAGAAGSGQHIHVSLIDGQGRNIFDDGGEAGTPALRQAIAGLMETLPAAMLTFAPTRASYRRLTETDFQVAARICWGYDSRFVPLRVPSGPPTARRVEHRVPGADANPYLAIAAILAGLLHGIDQGVEAPAPVTSTQQAQSVALASLPGSWAEAMALFDGPGPLSDLLGQDFIRHFAAAKRQERSRLEADLSPFEFRTYVGLG